ncbi:MAG TPA: Rieske 2Fe-2S domain-containing protein [Nitrososphaerales archaeon]|nr:Rieske 2Fe-2S domain-containing protein [Nitrososphaerales archaeon]
MSRGSSKKKQPETTKKPATTASGVSKVEARESLRTFQRLIGIAFVASAVFGIYLLSTDLSLWLLAVSHAYGLIAICAIDICLAIASFLSFRRILIVSALWAILTLALQLGDILTAPQYKMTTQYFVSYLFGLWAFDALLAAQVVVIVLVLSARKYSRILVVKKRLTYFDMAPKSSRRDFIQIMGIIAGLLALTGVLAALDAISGSNQLSGNPSTTTNSNLPSGAIANVKDLTVGSPVYFEYPAQGYPGILLKKADGTLSALSMLCTHVCCQCNYDPGSTEIFCPCHGSLFDQNGSVLRGPASLPLPAIQLRVDESGNVFPVKISGSSPCLSA